MLKIIIIISINKFIDFQLHLQYNIVKITKGEKELGKKAIIIGFAGEKLTNKVKQKIEALIESAITKHNVTEFYFGNDFEEFEELEIDEKPILRELVSNSHTVTDFIIETIKNYETSEKICVTLIVARPSDKNYNANLYDEIIQGYYIYHEELDSDSSLDAFDLRDTFLIENIDMVFWYSNPILVKTSSLFKCAENHNKQIVFE